MTLTQGHITEVRVTATLDSDNVSNNRIVTLTQGHIAKVKVTVYT